MPFSALLLSMLVVVVGCPLMVEGQKPTTQAEVNCYPIIVADQGTRIELLAQDVVQTESTGVVTLVIINPKRLKAIQELIAPVVTFCYKGHQLSAQGNPLLSSAVPEGAAAFYALTKEQKVYLAANRFSIGIVSDLVLKKN
jgi:hypothetical protein